MRAQDSATAESPIAVPAPQALDAPAPNSASGPAPVASAPTRTAAPPAPSPEESPHPCPAPAPPRSGLFLAVLGVVCFSLTFPGTAWALEGFGPWSLTTLRTVLAATVAGIALAARRVPPPARRHWAGLAVAASGVVIGFPLLTTLALQTSTTSHAAVVVGLLPLTTALYSCVRTGARPSRAFWVAAFAGAAVVIAFALHQSGGTPTTGDLYLCGALLICAAGYAEGGKLARELSGLEIIGWALVACLPLAVPGAVIALLAEPVELTAHSVTGLVWVAAGSQLLGLIVWYRAMGVAGVAKASQVQLAQPLLTLVWSVLLLGEHLTPAAPAAAAAVLVCIVVVQRSRA
ncbi:DMT family transporter [Streptomyces daliensis]